MEIGSTETAEQLESRLSFVGVDAVRDSIELLLRHSDFSQSPGVVQDAANISLAPRLRKSDGEVQWSRSAQEIYYQVRAFKPWPTTYTHWLPVDREPVRWFEMQRPQLVKRLLARFSSLLKMRFVLPPVMECWRFTNSNLQENDQCLQRIY